jgi:N-carbamoylputrescine amidase
VSGAWAGGGLAVALLQLAGHGLDQEAAAEHGERACRAAAARGADIAVFPELWNVGYALPENAAARRAWAGRAVGVGDPYVERFRALAAQLRMAIALTGLERWPGAPRNTVWLIDRRGEIALTYAKVHTCAFGPEAACAPGDGFPVCDLDTAAGLVRTGAMICFDREFPEAARLLMLAGAELLLVPNACELERHRLAQFHTRAFENVVAAALVNYAAPTFNGRSVLVDGIGFDERRRSRDMTVVAAGEEEELVVGGLDLERLRAARAGEILGDAWRRPSLYGALAGPEASPRSPREKRPGATGLPGPPRAAYGCLVQVTDRDRP